MQFKPDHTIRIVPYPARMRVLLRNQVVADTTGALMLYEGTYPAVPYIPRADVDMTMLSKSPTRTRFPLKGDATYFSLQSENAFVPDIAWSYERPFPNVSSIGGHLAFDVHEVEFIENNSP